MISFIWKTEFPEMTAVFYWFQPKDASTKCRIRQKLLWFHLSCWCSEQSDRHWHCQWKFGAVLSSFGALMTMNWIREPASALGSMTCNTIKSKAIKQSIFSFIEYFKHDIIQYIYHILSILSPSKQWKTSIKNDQLHLVEWNILIYYIILVK